MRSKVGWVIRLVDDLDGEILKGGLGELKVNGHTCKPLCKPNGYCVFMSRSEKSIVLEVCVAGYEAYEETLSLQWLDGQVPTYDIRLLPSRQYMKKVDRWIEGEAEKKNAEIFLVPQLETKLLKYGGVEKLEDEEWLIINSLSYAQIVRLNLAFVEDNMECFRVQEKCETNMFKLEKPLQKTHKLQEEIIRIYRGKTDEKGHFKIPVDSFYEAEKYEVFYPLNKE